MMASAQVEVDVLHIEEFQRFYQDIRDTADYLRTKKRLSVIEQRIIQAVDTFDALTERGEDD